MNRCWPGSKTETGCTHPGQQNDPMRFVQLGNNIQDKTPPFSMQSDLMCQQPSPHNNNNYNPITPKEL